MKQRVWKLIPWTAILILLALPAEARIKRSCDARMYIVLKGKSVEAVGGGTINYPPGERTLERFSATASCPWGQPNKCRKRAREKVSKCMKASWNERWQRTTPDDCKSDIGISGYDMPNIKCDLYDRICAEVREMGHPDHLGGTAIVKGESSGQTNSCQISGMTIGDEYVVADCSNYIDNHVEDEHCGY